MNLQDTLQKRILDISRRNNLSHLGSCLSVLPILIKIYQRKKPRDKVFLSGAHSHLAHLVVREHFEGGIDAERLLVKYGIHCDKKAGCDASGGSLGHLGIALGMALASPDTTVYAVITDGSSQEGSEYEALRNAYRLGVKNLVIHANLNGYTAIEAISRTYWRYILSSFSYPITFWSTTNGHPSLEGVQGHYLTVDKL